MPQNQLRDQLRLLRCNVETDRQVFIPQKSVYKLLTRDVVFTTLQQSGISPIHIDDLTDKILKGGQKLFAVLVLLKKEEGKILEFVKHDQLTASTLDSRLPLSLATLSTIVPDIATEFYEIQWELLAPVFSKGVLHRELHDMIKLPFVKNRQIGRGGFGDVFEIELETQHQTLPFAPKEDNLRAVRKEFKSDTYDEEDWRKELHNLSLLGELKHPNIIEMLSSYTHRRKHNLVFRLASHGDLATLFDQERPEGFEPDDSFFYALAQLASALCTVHNFASKKLNLKFIGCHHDLKPRNILFDGKTFILADFGLSRFHNATESSKEPFEIGQGHYLAPECEDYEDDFKKHIISRPSDIWSFGCIIAELLTYMLRGPGSTVAFRTARTITIDHLTTCTFHGGRFKPNPSVNAWLSELERQGNQTHRLSLQLVKSMLSLDPEDRPKAPQVSFKLGYVATISYIEAVSDLFSTLMRSTDSIEAGLEWRRFSIWTTLFTPTTTAEDSIWRVSEDPMTEFNPVLWSLIKCRDEISSILERYQYSISPLFSDLRALIDQLHSFLSPELKKLSRSQIEEDLVRAEDLIDLETMQNQWGDHPETERVHMLLTIKRMSILALQKERRTRPDLIADPNEIEIDTTASTGYVGEHTLAVQEDIDGRKRRIIVEWIPYTLAWEESVSEDLFTRVEAIASLLNNPAKPIHQVLHCTGYFHEPSRQAFGVIYEFPSQPPSGLPCAPKTLADVILSTMDTRSRPSLEDRYLLANQLANSIADCHKVGWMHKNISAHNVAFFHAQNANPISWIQNPHIIGFNHSRPNDPKAFTLGPGMARFKEYQHPLYNKGHGFIREFDFYSLGLVLLEIGLWTTIQTIAARWKLESLEDLQLNLLTKRVPLLSHSMGNGYRDAVEMCLRYLPGKPASLPSTIGDGQNLSLEVLARLGRCPCKTSQGFHRTTSFSQPSMSTE